MSFQGSVYRGAIAVAVVSWFSIACQDFTIEPKHDRLTAAVVPGDTTTPALQYAIDSACAAPGGPDTVDLAGQTYTLTDRVWIPGNPALCGQGEASRLVVRNGTIVGPNRSIVTDTMNRAWVTVTGSYTTLEYVTVRGEISVLTGGVMPTGCTFQDPENIDQTGCVQGINVGGVHNRFDHVTVTGHIGFGLHAYDGSSGSITNSTFTSNVISGISLDSVSTWEVSDTESNDNGENGIDVRLGGGHYIFSNTFSNNGFYQVGGDQQGILLNESPDNTVELNTISSNRIGVLAYLGSGNTLSENTVSYNEQVGIIIGVSDTAGVSITPDTYVDNNIVHHNTQAGIRIGYVPWSGGTSEVRNINVSENTVYSNNNNFTGYQIEFVGTQVSTRVEYNMVTRPGECFPISYSGVTFTGNTCSW